MLKASLLSAALLIIVATTTVVASPPDRRQTIVTEVTYTMSDTDTLATAEQTTLLRAQQKAIEEAGIYIESSFTDQASSTGDHVSQTSALTIRTIAAAVLETDILDRKTFLDHGRPTFTMRIRAVVDLGHLEEAVERFRHEAIFADHFRTLQSENAQLKSEVAHLQHELDQVRTAARTIRIESATELTDRALRTGTWAEKIALTSRAIELNRQDAAAYVIRGQTLLHVGLLQVAQDQHPEDRQWFLIRACADFSRAITLNAINTWALFGRAECLAGQSLSAQALQDYKQVLRIDPLFDLARERMTLAAVSLAKAAVAQRQWERALQPLDQLLGTEPLPAWIASQSEAYLLRSRILATLHRPSLALQDVDTLLGILPSHREALYQRAKVYRQLGDWSRATRDLASACEHGMHLACPH